MRGSTYCLQANTCAKKGQHEAWAPTRPLRAEKNVCSKLKGSAMEDWEAVDALAALRTEGGVDEPPDEEVDSV